jgi:aspartyl-tRNA(Asn)/glutamyl-tRNA(Gln) amidotransferase subunit C
MSIDAATVKRVAKLARLAVPEAQAEPLAQELSAIMAWIEQLNEVDTDGVEPMASCVAAKLPLREDGVADGGQPDKVLSNAPRRAGDFFVVPKVVE